MPGYMATTIYIHIYLHIYIYIDLYIHEEVELVGIGQVHVSGPNMGILHHQCSLRGLFGIVEYHLVSFRACKYIRRKTTIAGINNHVRKGGWVLKHRAPVLDAPLAQGIRIVQLDACWYDISMTPSGTLEQALHSCPAKTPFISRCSN